MRNFKSTAIALLGAGLISLGAPAGAQKVIVTKPSALDAPNAPMVQAFGEARSGSYLGVYLEEVTQEKVTELGLREEYGAHITKVSDDSPAAKAGLQADDVVLTWNGTRVESSAMLQRLVSETPAGRTARIGVFRQGQGIVELPAEIGERPSNGFRFRTDGDGGHAYFFGHDDLNEHLLGMNEELQLNLEKLKDAHGNMKVFRFGGAEGEDLFESLEEFEINMGDGNSFVWAENSASSRARIGVQLQSMTEQLAGFFGVNDRNAVLVAAVVEGSPAEEAGLRAGDVILSVGGEEVEDVGTATRTIRKKVAEQFVDLRIMRDKRELTLTVDMPTQDGAASTK